MNRTEVFIVGLFLGFIIAAVVMLPVALERGTRTALLSRNRPTQYAAMRTSRRGMKS